MTLPVPPLTLFKYARVLWFLGNAADVLRPHLFDYWQGLASSGDLVWMKFVVKIEDLTSTITADDQQITFNIVNYTGGSIDTSWTDGDLNTCEQAIANYIVIPWCGHMTDGHAFTRISAYQMNFADAPPITDPDWQKAPKFLKSGPPVKEWVLNNPGLVAGGRQAPQVACSVTWETPIRYHWGRFYLPAPAASLVDASGRIVTSTVTEVAGHVDDFAQALASSEFYNVIPSTQDSKKPIRALQQVTGVRMDDVFDVIRRRRLKYANFRARHDVDTPLQQPAAAAAELEE